MPLTPVQYGDALIEKYKPMCAGNSQTVMNDNLAIQCALIDVQNTIDALKEIFGTDEDKQPDIVYYQQVLSHIQSKLK